MLLIAFEGIAKSGYFSLYKVQYNKEEKKMLKKAFAVLALCLPAAAVNATLVTVSDLDTVNVNSTDSYIYDCALSSTNTLCSFKFLLDPGEIVNFTITPPVETRLYSLLTSEFDYGGRLYANPSTTALFGELVAGVSFTYIIDGTFRPTQVVTIGVGGDELAIINKDLGGSLDVMGLLEGTTGLFDPGGTGGGNGNGTGNGNGVGTVPAPPALLLFASGIAALMGFGTRRQGRTGV